MREVWVITACVSLVNATASHYKEGLAAADIEKEFYRLQGDLYSLCRVKVIVLHVSEVIEELKFWFHLFIP